MTVCGDGTLPSFSHRETVLRLTRTIAASFAWLYLCRVLIARTTAPVVLRRHFICNTVYHDTLCIN